MTRARVAAIAAATLVLLVAAFPAPANAQQWWPKTNCDRTGESSHLCVDVYAHTLAGGGLSLDHVYLRLEGGFWENKAIDCDWLTARNDNGVVKWRKDGAQCDVYKDPGYTLFHPSYDMPGSSKITVTVGYWAKLDKEQNPPYMKTTVVIP